MNCQRNEHKGYIIISDMVLMENCCCVVAATVFEIIDYCRL